MKMGADFAMFVPTGERFIESQHTGCSTDRFPLESAAEEDWLLLFEVAMFRVSCSFDSRVPWVFRTRTPL